MRYYRKHKISWFRKYPFIRYLIPIIIGILSYNYFSFIDGRYILWSCIFSLIGAFITHHIRIVNDYLQLGRSVFLYSCILLLSWLNAYYSDYRNRTEWYGHQLENADGFLVEVREQPEKKKKTILLPLEVKRTIVGQQRHLSEGKINLYLYLQDSLPYPNKGDILLVPNRLVKIKNNKNPFGFDYARFLERKNIFHQAFMGIQEIKIIQQKENSLTRIETIKKNLIHSIDQNIPDLNTKSIVLAMLLNDRTLLDNELWKAYSITGIAHIIAISGMHVSILFGILLFLLKWWRVKRWENYKYLIALPIIWFYIWITNFPPSAVRAATMFSLLTMSLVMNRKSTSLHLLLVTGVLLLIYNPNWLFDVGVQLSFSAVFSIFVFYKPILQLWKPKYQVTQYFWNIIAVSLAAQIFVFPIVIYYFHQFPIWVILANIPASIYSLVLMIGGILLIILDLFQIPCAWLGSGLMLISQYFHKAIYFFSDHTPLYMRQLYLNLFDLFLLMAGVIFLSYSLLQKKRLFLRYAFFSLKLLIISFIVQDLKAIDQQKIIVFNSPEKPCIYLLNGKKHQRYFYSDIDTTIQPSTFQYNFFPAEVGFRAVKRFQPQNDFHFWQIEGKRILYWSSFTTENMVLSLRPDFLIISSNYIFSKSHWEHLSNVQLVILDSSIPRWKAKKWKQELDSLSIPSHWIADEGAWVYGN